MAEKIAIPTRDELVRKYERDYLLRNPDAKVGEGTLPGIDARVFVDQLLPIYAEANAIGGTQNLENLSGSDLEDEAEDLGLPRRLPPAGASGSVTITASAGGAVIVAGQKGRSRETGKTYRCTLTRLYQNGDSVPVAGIDTGPETNLRAGSLFEWSAPPFGLSNVAVVVEQSDGSGLTGGRLEETDPEIRDRIRAERAMPAAAGNSADYRRAALATPNLGIQAAFTYAAVLGPGTIGLAFTMRPSASGASRRPNAAQISAVRANVIGQMPKDDSVFVYSLLPDTVDMDLRVRWRRSAVGWTNAAPWPKYSQSAPVEVVASPAPTATTFRLRSANPATSPPAPGQVIAFYNTATRSFVRKALRSITATVGSSVTWDVVADDANTASDTSFVPAAGDRPMPWSDSLPSLLEPLLAEFDKLGPGDHVTFDSGGLRRRREPTGYEAYPYELSGRALSPLYELPSVDDVQVASPSLPHSPPVGTPSVSAYIIELGALRVYPL